MEIFYCGTHLMLLKLLSNSNDGKSLAELSSELKLSYRFAHAICDRASDERIRLTYVSRNGRYYLTKKGQRFVDDRIWESHAFASPVLEPASV